MLHVTSQAFTAYLCIGEGEAQACHMILIFAHKSKNCIYVLQYQLKVSCKIKWNQELSCGLLPVSSPRCETEGLLPSIAFLLPFSVQVMPPLPHIYRDTYEIHTISYLYLTYQRNIKDLLSSVYKKICWAMKNLCMLYLGYSNPQQITETCFHNNVVTI